MSVERELKRGSFPVASKAAWIEIANGSSVELHRVDGDGILRHLLYTAPETPYPGIAGVSSNPSRLRQRFAHPDLSVVNSWLHEGFAADVREFTLQTGPEGTRIKSTGDLCALLEGALGLDIGLYWQADDHTHATAAACLLACEMSGVRPESLRGGWGYDPLASFARTGSLSGGAHGSAVQLRELIEWSRHRSPGMTAFQVSSTPLSDACASDALELGWSLAAGVYYLRELNALGLQPSEVMPLAEVCVSVGTDFLSAVSKLRAARMLWSHLLESLGMTDPSIRLHADCSPRSHSSIAPHNNMLRTTTQAISAMCGGPDSMSIPSFDAPSHGYSSLGRRIARNTHHILRLEAGLHDVVDPGAGSYAIEQHTHSLAATAWKEFQNIEKSGGALQALLNGSIRQRVTNQRLQDARDVGRGRRVLVGVTRFAHPTEDDSREPINMREVEYQLGRPHANAPIDLADTETNPAISLSAAQGPFGSATSELAAGASLSAVSANLVKGKPSLHTEPLPHYRRAAEIESLVASVRGWARLNKQPVRAAIALIGEASASARSRQQTAVKTLQVTGVETDTVHLADLDALVDWTPDSAVRITALVGDDTILTALRSETVDRLVESGSRCIFTVDAPGGLGVKLVRHSSFVQIRSEDDILLQARDVLLIAGVVR